VLRSSCCEIFLNFPGSPGRFQTEPNEHGARSDKPTDPKDFGGREKKSRLRREKRRRFFKMREAGRETVAHRCMVK